jgi:hypothetical protein
MVGCSEQAYAKTPAFVAVYFQERPGAIVFDFAKYQSESAGFTAGLWGQSAGKIRRLVDTACAVVASDLRVGAEWASAIDFACGAVGSDDARRGFSLLDPPFNEADFVERVGAFSANAMSHAGHHEETDPIRALS